MSAEGFRISKLANDIYRHYTILSVKKALNIGLRKLQKFNLT